MALFPESDDPDRFVPGAEFVTDGPVPRHLVLTSVRPHKGRLVAAFAGVVDRNQAEDLRNQSLTVPRRARRPLGDGEYWPDELLGLEVRDVSGRVLGRVAGVELGAVQDRLVVETGAGSVEVPLVDELVPDVRVDERFVVVDPPAGLFAASDEP